MRAVFHAYVSRRGSGALPARQVILLASVAAAAVSLSLLSYSYFQYTSGEITKIVTGDLQEEARVEAYHLSGLMESKIQLIDNNLETLVLSPSIMENDLNEAKLVINNRQNSTSEITDRYVWLDSAGKTVWSSGFANESEYMTYRGTDVSFRPYFKEPRDTLLPYYSTTIESLDGVPRLFLSHPIIGNGSKPAFEGVVFSAITFQNLGSILESSMSPELSSNLIVTDTDSLTVYSSNPADMGKKLQVGMVSQSSAENTQSFDQMLQQSHNGKTGSYDFVGDGTSKTVAYAPIDIRDNHFLTLYILVPHNVSMKIDPLLQQNNNFALAITLAIGGVAIGTSILILSWNKALQTSVNKKTEELKQANEYLVNANAKLEVQDRVQKEFINIAAHELRTPVQPILGMTEILEKDLGDRREDIRLIARNARRLERLTQDILDVTRIESNSLQLHKERINLNDLILPLVEDYRNQVTNGGTKIIYEPKDIFIEADRERLTQVISNLLGNAFKFTKNGSISIAAGKLMAKSA